MELEWNIHKWAQLFARLCCESKGPERRCSTRCVTRHFAAHQHLSHSPAAQLKASQAKREQAGLLNELNFYGFLAPNWDGNFSEVLEARQGRRH